MTGKKMKYDIQSIPTKYNDVQFRSRLEASWAAFFDLIGWRWEYEPFELDGWFPDFKLSPTAEGGHDLLVEVKPIDFYDNDLLKSIANKILLPSIDEVLLLGNSPINSWDCDENCIGMLVSRFEYEITGDLITYDPAILNNFIHGWDVAAYYGSYAGRLSGDYDGNLNPISQESIEAIWKKARNLTQWRKHG